MSFEQLCFTCNESLTLKIYLLVKIRNKKLAMRMMLSTHDFILRNQHELLTSNRLVQASPSDCGIVH